MTRRDCLSYRCDLEDARGVARRESFRRRWSAARDRDHETRSCVDRDCVKASWITSVCKGSFFLLVGLRDRSAGVTNNHTSSKRYETFTSFI